VVHLPPIHPPNPGAPVSDLEPELIAALYVETNGCYFGLPGVDPWDINRDARTYTGLWPVVAHPPCERWGRFSEGSMTRKVYKTGDDDGCFDAAWNALAKWGGVLEHPACSKAWTAYNVPRPPKAGWLKVGVGERFTLWTCEVEQGHYGHVARKKTWLLYAGLTPPPDLIWGTSGQRLPARRLAEKGYEKARRGGMVANQCSKHRQRTPPMFRDLLLSLAVLSTTPAQATA
jgi:hypothetical protein